MLSSKDILERTGISRATLNNYISYGLVPRPQVLPPEPGDAGAPRIGYFPDDTAARVETIQRLKREGWSLGRILDHFGAQAAEPEAQDEAGATEEPEPSVFPPPAAASPAPVRHAAHAFVRSESETPETLAVAVLSVTMADADGLWTSLLVQEYFELANEFCGLVQGEVRMHAGRCLRSSPHRLVCHFLPTPGRNQFLDALGAALALRGAVRGLSQRWQLRKGWLREISLRCGAAAGEAWVSQGSGASDDLQVVGDAGHEALVLSRACRDGAVLATRDLIGRLPSSERSTAVFGIPGQPDGSALQLMVFTRLRDFAPQLSMPRRMGDLPVAELVELGAATAPARGSLT